jgi:4-amino-4-deoxy-L-arabinose transferase-like glycosyltransferase
MTPIFKHTRRPWALVLLAVCTFFLLLGNRGLEEPDEGRYAEVAREMIESGDWLVPHLWYLPHLDKPPLTYWAVAASMKLFAQNEWAVRLPVALAGLSGVWAAWLLACSLGGRRAGCWSVLILQTSLLYFAMARLLTPDIFLTQFVAWAVYFFWRSWLCLRKPPAGASVNVFWAWHLGGWLVITLGFLTKGPIAFIIPSVALVVLSIFRWQTFDRKGLLFGGWIIGLALCLLFAAPWFVAVNRRVPHTLDYMVFHQLAGHIAGSAIKNRHGFPLYFFVVLAAGLLPWSWLLGWLWRRAHWVAMPEVQKDGWLLLNGWGIFTFTLFSLTHSKLAAYILPIFPALAVMLAMRFFGEAEEEDAFRTPGWVWSLCALSPLLSLVVFSVAIPRVFHLPLPQWMLAQVLVVCAAAVGILWVARKWTASTRAAMTVGAAILSLLAIAQEAPRFTTELGANQTVKPLGFSLRENYHAGDVVVCWGQLPEGLPFYSQPAISMTNRPFLGGMNLTRAPFEFPGNRERLGPLLLPGEEALRDLLKGNRRVLMLAHQDASRRFQKIMPDLPLRVVASCGRWDLLANQ